MGDFHISDSLHESGSPRASELIQAMRRYAVWRRFVKVGIGVGLFSIAVCLLSLLWPDLRPISTWVALVSSLVGVVGLALAIAIASYARERLRRAQAGLPAVPASVPVFYGLLKAGLVAGVVGVSVGLPGAATGWLVEWWFASHYDKPAPAVIGTVITTGLTLTISGACLLAIALGFFATMRRNETRERRPAAGR